MIEKNNEPVQTQQATAFEPSTLVEYGSVADLTQNNVNPSANSDGVQYS